MVATETAEPRRVEMILRQIDALPTLPAVAARLLELTSSDDSRAGEVIEMVSADPALTARVLSLCKAADRGVRLGLTEGVLTVERAVLLLGFTAVRNVVLSLSVFDLFENDDDPSPTGGRLAQAPGAKAAGEDGPGFDRKGFWTHSLAVAVAAECIAQAHPGDPELAPDQAFVCGLLHDLGKLALDRVLPKAFGRAVDLARTHRGSLAEYERRVIGMDHHTAGKRLAEQWGLPHRIQDCLWLHGAPADTLPDLPHRRLVGLIGLADRIVRRQHLGDSGNCALPGDAEPLCRELGLDPALVEAVSSDLYPALEERSRLLGLDQPPSRELLLGAIQSANHALGKLNTQLERRSRVSAAQTRVLDAVASFHGAATPGQSVQDVLDEVARSAAPLLGEGFYALLYPSPPSSSIETWTYRRYSPQGEATGTHIIEAPPGAPDLRTLEVDQPTGMNLLGLLPWIADDVVDAPDLRAIRLLPLPCAWGAAGLLLHDRTTLPPAPALSALSHAWGSAVASAAQHDGARRMGEQLAESNRALAEAQDRLLRQESLARVGEMAAGAAHEMNNPLAVISGRSQLLAMSLPAGSKEQQSADQIVRESHRLSDLITGLHLFSDPPQPDRKPVDVAKLVHRVVVELKQARSKRRDPPEITLQVRDTPGVMLLDADQVQRALTELLLNAVQANPKTMVSVAISTKPYGSRSAPAICIEVRDDGDGMDAHTLSHAADPFFSAKPAGRQVGLGLSRAQQLAEAHGGEIELRSEPGEGSTATLWLPIGPLA
ncbi:MAG: HDOD domain-containing protein [Planctomycetota bacterium]